jgi:xanthine dehydrogenase molybdopterin-binding subunit B
MRFDQLKRRKFITLSRDLPLRFNVRILDGVAARAATISRGIGKPPIHLATAVWTALTPSAASPTTGPGVIGCAVDPGAHPDGVERLRARQQERTAMH